MKLGKYLKVPLMMAVMSTPFACGTESPTHESSLMATAQETSALKAIQDVLNGVDITTALGRATLSASQQVAVWDFYKAHAGLDWQQGVQVRIQGAERRKWIRAGQIHASALLAAAKNTAEGKAIQKSIQSLYLKAFKEQKGLTYQASVYSYVSLPNADLDKITPVLLKVPASQREFVAPILIVKAFPGSRTTGGAYFTPAEVITWLGRESVTGVPDQDIQDFIQSSGHGIVAISKTALLDQEVHPFSILHEVAHSIDHFIKIVPPGATVEMFRGVIYPKRMPGEYATEAYARYMFNKKVCRNSELPALGEDQAQCSKRIITELNKAPAFLNNPLR